MGTDNKPTLINGMPDTSDKQTPGFKAWIALLAFTFVPAIIGFLIALAWTNYSSSNAKYNERMAATGDTVWLFAASVVLSRTVAFVNAYPLIMWKTRIMGKDGNLRANPFFYKIIGAGASDDTTVVLQDAGDVGGYNRANRSIHHMVENMGGFLASLYLVGTVFPFPAFVCTCLWCLGRIMHQIGYTTGYGGHGAGFGINLLADVILQGFATVVVVIAGTPIYVALGDSQPSFYTAISTALGFA